MLLLSSKKVFTTDITLKYKCFTDIVHKEQVTPDVRGKQNGTYSKLPTNLKFAKVQSSVIDKRKLENNPSSRV